MKDCNPTLAEKISDPPHVIIQGSGKLSVFYTRTFLFNLSAGNFSNNNDADIMHLFEGG
jgi:hypothetical protein